MPTRIIRNYKLHKLIAIVGIGGVILILGLLYWNNQLPFLLHKKPVAGVTGNSYTKAVQPTTHSSQNASAGSTDSNSPNGNQTSLTTNAPLLAPWGTFANLYHAQLSDQMGSTCNTTPGATCQIIFTNGATTKSLNAEIADAGGAVYWAWKPAEIGLTPDTWHMTMKATLGNEVKTTNNDPLTLEVTQ